VRLFFAIAFRNQNLDFLVTGDCRLPSVLELRPSCYPYISGIPLVLISFSLSKQKRVAQNGVFSVGSLFVPKKLFTHLN
jgi:hypothetical protein